MPQSKPPTRPSLGQKLPISKQGTIRKQKQAEADGKAKASKEGSGSDAVEEEARPEGKDKEGVHEDGGLKPQRPKLERSPKGSVFNTGVGMGFGGKLVDRLKGLRGGKTS